MTASAGTPRLGYAVIDTETTGLLTGYRHRIAEIAVIHLDPDGTTTDEWCTLLNPDAAAQAPDELRSRRPSDGASRATRGRRFRVRRQRSRRAGET